MDSNFSPNYVEHIYDKKAEGGLLLARILFVIGYIIFVGVFFLVCYISRLIPLFAICPIVTWILVFFTWRFVSYDIYYTFEHGALEVGKIRVNKRGRHKRPAVKIDMRCVTYVGLYCNDESKRSASGITIGNFSERLSSANAILIVYKDGTIERGIVIEAIPQLQRLLKSFCKEAYSVD